MTVDYTRRAVADLIDITAYYEGLGAAGIGGSIAARIDEVIARIEVWPESGKRVAQDHSLRLVPLIRFPHLIFYEVAGAGTIRILHIRHASRRPWTGG
jgi:plasmid stabilization system protein ParE